MKNSRKRNFAEARPPALCCRYLGEPPLVFADGREDIDPKLGLSRFGPKSWRPQRKHPDSVRVGFMGPGDAIEQARQWIEKSAQGVHGDVDHPEFPGFTSDSGFMSQLAFDNDWNAPLFRAELNDLTDIRPARRRFERFVEILDEKVKLLSEKDQSPQYIVLALPKDLYRKYRSVDYMDGKLGQVHRDLRRAFKAIAMEHHIPTQILREPTATDTTGDNLSKIAWNFFTGLYFKAGGTPWGPIGLQPGTCYIGVSFYRPLGSALSTIRTSLVQAFDEHGDGLVLRGHEFTWDAEKEGTNSPHLSADQAEALVKLVLDRYQQEMGQKPQRVVIHKTSRYWPGEQAGFERVLAANVQRYDLLALTPQSSIRLLATNQYPPLRSTAFSFDDMDFLYTTGFIAELGQFHSLHVPAPLQVADHIGNDTPREVLLREILILTKMNWNSARLGGLLPITLRFSKLVADILRELPEGREPRTNFKYYM